MFEPELPSNSLLKKTKDIISLKIFKETLKSIKDKCILIVDKRGSYFLNNFFTLTEVINLGIISIESIYFERKPYPKNEAIYIISGCEKSIDNISKDFVKGKKPLYKACHIFTLDEINDELINIIIEKESKKFYKYIKTLKQIMINFIPIDKNMFSFGNDNNFNCFFNLYENDKNKITTEITVEKLVSVCQSLDNYPNIVYFSPDKYCKLIAEKVNSSLKKYYTKKKNLKKSGILLITTRYIDFLAPIQFGLNFQHASLESFKKKDDKYYNKVFFKYEVKENNKKIEKEIILNYKNEIYNKYKNMQIGEVLGVIDDDFKTFVNSDVGKIHKIEKDEKNEIDLGFALKNVSKYQYYYDLFSGQINLCKQLDINLKKRGIMNLISIQKEIISKINEKGKKIPEKEIISLIKDNKNLFNKDDLLRILCFIKYQYSKISIDDLINDIETINIKFSENDKKIINFFDKSKCVSNSDVIEQLEDLIISYREENNYDTKEDKENQNDKSYPFVKESKLTTLCDMCGKNKLPKAFFSFVEKPENLPQKKVKINLGLLGNKQDDEEDDNSKQNLILYNIGGLSNFEIASIEKGADIGQWGINLILGANKIYNYREYFIELSNYMKGNNSIKKVVEEIPIEIDNKKKKDKKDRENNKKEKPHIDIDNSEININNEGKYSKEKMNTKGIKSNLSDDSDLK